MTDLPDWLDFAASENAAAAMYRGLSGPSASWGELIATAQAIMGIYQDTGPEEIESLYDERNVLPLIAASRILDTAAQPRTGLNEYEQRNLGLAAAVCFGMYANFPSATAVICRSLGEFDGLSPSTAVIVAVSAPNHIGKVLASCDLGTRQVRFLETLEYFLTTGNASYIAPLRKAFVNCLLEAPSAFEGSLLRSARLSLEHMCRLSMARTLQQYCPELPGAYVLKLVNSGARLCLPPQFKAVKSTPLLQSSENSIIAFPTSTGKTLLGEMCIADALRGKPGLACYLAPYVALGRQVAESLELHLPEPMRVHPMVGGYQDPESLDPENYSEVVVATPERFDAMLRISPGLIQHLRCVICDEAHNVENYERGVRLEGILTRLRLLQAQGNRVRLVLLSAVLAQYEAVQKWLGVPKELVLTDSWRPTARRLAFWTQDGRLTWFLTGDPIRPSGATHQAVLGERRLPWPDQDIYSTQLYGAVKAQKPLVQSNIAYLAHLLISEYGGPVLCVCATKEDTRTEALAIAERFPLLSPLPKTVKQAIASIEKHHPFLLPLCDILRRGVAFHNSTVPHEVRQLIERALSDQEIIAVVATTTLAEGVDLPFRFTIIVDWLTWQTEGRQRPMPPLLFRNIAGRCGRAGMFTEGDTVIYDNPLGDEKYTVPSLRGGHLRETFLSGRNIEPRSALEEPLSEKDETLLSALASQFMAAIPESPNSRDLARQFAEATLWGIRQPRAPLVKETVTRIEASLLDPSDGALAAAASPIRLTPLGEAANVTGFSPVSCRRILKFLRNPDNSGDVVAVSAKLLRALGTLPEQSNGNLRKALTVKGSRFCVKGEDLDSVLDLWLKRTSREKIFASLPYVQRSSIKPPIEEWIKGWNQTSKWDAEFDKFTDFIGSVIEGFLPWLMRSCHRLCPHVGGWAIAVPWLLWAESMEMAGVLKFTSAVSVIQGKLARGEFDVFLCYNSADKAVVMGIGERLKTKGILPWLDQWSLHGPTVADSPGRTNPERQIGGCVCWPERRWTVAGRRDRCLLAAIRQAEVPCNTRHPSGCQAPTEAACVSGRNGVGRF